MQLVREEFMPRVDLGVVQNTNGMIRMLGSLNGKTGLRCMSLAWDALDAFDPFIDANPHRRDTNVEVLGKANRAIVAGGERFAVEAGKTTALPLHVATIFICSDSASAVG
jgi:DNA primase small subunit